MKKTKALWALYIFATTFLYSCYKDQQGLIDSTHTQMIQAITYSISELEALNTIAEFNANLVEQGWENPLNIYEDFEIEYIPGEYLIPYIEELNQHDIYTDAQSDNLPETILYIFNFSNGCAVVSADYRIGDNVFALIENKHLYPEDLEYEAIFRRTSLEQADYNFVAINNMMFCNIMDYICQIYNPNYFDEEGISRWTDSINTIILEPMPYFHQHAPFNDSCLVGQNHALAGCGPIAMLALIIYNNTVTIDNFGISYNRGYWMRFGLDGPEVVDTEERKRIASIVKQLGQSTNSTWGITATSTNPDSVITTMNSLGYDMERQNCDITTIKEMIDNNHPIIFTGHENSSGEGHGFVVSGMTVKRKSYEDIYHNTIHKRSCLLYCNNFTYDPNNMTNPTSNPEQTNGWFFIPELSNIANSSNNDRDILYPFNLKMNKYSSDGSVRE